MEDADGSGAAAAAAEAGPSADELLASTLGKVGKLEAELSTLKVTFAEEQKGFGEAKDEIIQLKLRLGDEIRGDSDIDFSSDGEDMDLPEGGAEDGLDGPPVSAEVKKLRGSIATLRLENNVLKAGGAGAGAPPSSPGMGSMRPDEKEMNQLRATVITLEEQLASFSGDIPVVPVMVVEMLKDDHAKQIAMLEAKYRSGEAPPPLKATVLPPSPTTSTDESVSAVGERAAGDTLLMAGAVNARHKLEIACYRQQLLMAFQGKLSDEIKRALQGVLSLQNQTTSDDEDLPSPPPPE